MVWPTDSLTKANFDEATDSPASARAELEALYDHVKLISAEVTDGATVWHSGNDGPTSTLNADLLDNEEGSFYRNASNINAGKIANAYVNTGAGNGLDADLLDGNQGTYYNDLSNATGTLTNNVDTDSLTVNGSAITDIVNITKIYAGQVASGGTWTDQPGSWTVSAGGTSNSQYTITHNLGSSNYAVIATPIGASFKATIVSKSTNSFVIGTLDSSNNVYSQAAFDFMLIHG